MADLGTAYRIQKGDTLWDIAAAELGSPWEWPRLFAFNNRSGVLHTGVRRIVDPDLIYAGETLRIPRMRAAPIAAGARSQRFLPRGDAAKPPRLRDVLPEIRVPFSIAYDLEKLPKATFRYPAYTVTIQLGGRVAIELGEKFALTHVLNRGIETSLKARTDQALGQLISGVDASFDPRTQRASFTNKLISQSNLPRAPETAIAVSVGSSRVPVLRAEITYPVLRGRIGADLFWAHDFEVVLEIELSPAGRQPSSRHVPSSRPVMVIGGVALLVGTIVADFLTFGASLADDPITVSLALSIIAGGLGMAGSSIPGGQPIRQQM